MLETLRPSDAGTVIALDPETNQAVLGEIARLIGHEAGPVLVCAPQLRSAVRRLIESAGLDVAVLSYRELPATAVIVSVGVVAAPSHALSA